MREAINEAKKSSIKGASTKYGIPYITLQRRVKTGSSTKKLGRFTSIFTEAEELGLVQHLKDLDALFYGLTKTEFMQLVGEFAKRNNKQTTFKKKRLQVNNGLETLKNVTQKFYCAPLNLRP